MRFTGNDGRAAVSAGVIAGFVVAVIAVAAVGAYLTLGVPPQSSTSTPNPISSSSAIQVTTSTTPTSSSLSTMSSPSSTSTTKSTASSSPSSSSTTTTSTSSAFYFDFVIGSTPGTILVTPGGTANYPLLTLQPLPAASSGSETVKLNSIAPTGLTVTLSASSVALTTDTKAYAGITVTSSQSVTPGDYTITVSATYGTTSKTSSITVKVVKYLVQMQTNLFNPANLTLKQGTTVYWINMDAPGGQDPEIHNVVFSSGSSDHSASMAQYDEYSYTFTTAGTYTYFCAFHAGMKGTITVTSG